mmetsp:Transcript_4162/g.7999  ORF Transcript_4162/g.7999 Transcript_4162/m.7999 type:complete len:516 (-) Transcript_4162:154-1701(-)
MWSKRLPSALARHGSARCSPHRPLPPPSRQAKMRMISAAAAAAAARVTPAAPRGRPSPRLLFLFRHARSRPGLRCLSTASPSISGKNGAPGAGVEAKEEEMTRDEEEAAQREASASRAMAWWLFGCAGMVFGMVALGGITRLTGSGLSMVEWKPTGILPPLTEEGWMDEFAKYQRFPEYQKHKDDLSLSEFKWIWYMEWGHRMAGRVTGIAFALPLAYFAMRGVISRRLAPRLAGLLLLGGGQGLIGWWMVKSGLDDKERYGEEGRVSPYRLATHLSMAFILYTGLVNTGMGLSTRAKVLADPSRFVETAKLLNHVPLRLKGAAMGVASLVGLTAFSGAFVAGNHAGMVYDEFPTMGGQWIPDDLVNPYIQPLWKNVFEHDTMVQWNHRVLAMTTLASVTGLYAASRRVPLPPNARLAANAMLAMSGVQVSLGISTLLLHVPVPLASAHQMGSLSLLTLSLWFVHTLLPLPLKVAASSAGAAAAAARTTGSVASVAAIAAAATTAPTTCGDDGDD